MATVAGMDAFTAEISKRRDQSLYVTHFTRCFETANGALTPGEVLRSILRERRVRASEMSDLERHLPSAPSAVCLTESPLLGLIVPLEPRSAAHGIGFNKRFVFAQGGSPVMYLRRDLLRDNGHLPVDEKLYPFLKLFDLESNYTYERVWRVAHDLKFELRDVAYVIVPRDERSSFCEEFPELRRIIEYEFLLEAM